MLGARTCRIALVSSMLLALAGLVSVGWRPVIQKWIRVLYWVDCPYELTYSSTPVCALERRRVMHFCHVVGASALTSLSNDSGNRTCLRARTRVRPKSSGPLIARNLHAHTGHCRTADENLADHAVRTARGHTLDGSRPATAVPSAGRSRLNAGLPSRPVLRRQP